MPTPTTIERLEKWYNFHCDGSWEHSWGIKIDTLDNPGWSVIIDLDETNLTTKPFPEVHDVGDGPHWIHCRVKENKFRGSGGPFMLTRILETFLQWANETE
jgi:hypothetical protein